MRWVWGVKGETWGRGRDDLVRGIPLPESTERPCVSVPCRMDMWDLPSSPGPLGGAAAELAALPWPASPQTEPGTHTWSSDPVGATTGRGQAGVAWGLVQAQQGGAGAPGFLQPRKEK